MTKAQFARKVRAHVLKTYTDAEILMHILRNAGVGFTRLGNVVTIHDAATRPQIKFNSRGMLKWS